MGGLPRRSSCWRGGRDPKGVHPPLRCPPCRVEEKAANGNHERRVPRTPQKSRCPKQIHTANRVLAILSAMFCEKGGEFGLPDDWTPTAKIKRYPETARDRVLKPEELAALLKAIDADENETVRDYFRMMLYTGARKSNVAEMKWDDISPQRKTWEVPGVKMKNDMPLVVNLTDDAIAILTRRKDSVPADSEYVFPARALTAGQVEQVRALHAEGKSTRQIARTLGISQSGTMRAVDPAFTPPEPPRPFNGVQKAWERILGASRNRQEGQEDHSPRSSPHVHYQHA